MKLRLVAFTLRRICFTVSCSCSHTFATTSVCYNIKLNFSTMPAAKKSFSRLPTDVIPINYDLWLKPCLTSFIFDGKQDVKVQVKKSTQQVVLNSVDIEVSSASYAADDGSVVPVKEISYNKDEEKVMISFSQNLPTGTGVLNMIFKGEVNNKMKGFYRSKYTAANGEERFAAVTQFESTSARRCFPCWDEPALKATFDTTLVIPKDLVGLSNMNVIEEHQYKEDSNFKVLRYAQTPIMSTYLLAFVVGEYDYLESETVNGVNIKVYTPVGKKEQVVNVLSVLINGYTIEKGHLQQFSMFVQKPTRGQFALEVAVKALPFYEEYFGIPYPLVKMDLIAIADFAAGAMENWGLVTYRETALLIDEASSSAQTRQWVALVVSHELAHQWFGNLVTMEWWTHLWLNEGFASFIEYLATDHCHPKFDIWTQFITHDLVRAMDLDALDNSHAIEIPVGHPDEVDEIFDLISYSKGASVIRMLHNWIGDESFRRGLHGYLTKHAYNNAFTEDLWDSLAEASGKPVRKVMSTWTKQMGYPVLDVECKSRTDNSITLTIRQSKFRANASKKVDDGVMPMWFIPVSFSTPASPHEPVKSILIEDAVTEVTIDNVPRNGWVKVNPGTYGFYRVRYSSDLLSALLPAVKNQTLNPRDRLALQSDIFALASSGFVPTTDYLKTLAAYENETNYTVWNDVNGKIGSLFTLLWNDDESFNRFKKFSLKLFTKISEKLGWDPRPDESHLDNMLRSLAVGRMGRCGCEKTNAESMKRFSAHVEKSSPLHADLRAAVYGNVVSQGGRKILDSMLALHKETDHTEERNRIERSIGCVKEEELMKNVLNFALSDNVRDNDKVFVIISLAMSHREGRDMAWDFTKKNWEKLHDMYNGQFLIARLVKCTTENFSSEQMAKEIEEFFEKNRADAAERTVQQSLEQIRQKSDWWKRDGEAIVEWLKNNA